MSKTLILAAGLAAALSLAPAVFADGEALYTSKICVTCHGADGKGPIMPVYPSLAGQSSEYCVQQTKDIREGNRTNALSAAMKASVAAVSDDEIKAICDWLATK